jgi:glycine/D-amino acid oxidase-like deaminating enzyme
MARCRGASAASAPSVAVVGAGVVGATTALELARRDADVTLFEAGDVADGASGRAAGVCYDAFADPVDAELAARSLETFREREALDPRPYVWLARDGDERTVEAMAEAVPRMREAGRDVSFVDSAALAGRWPALRTDDVTRAAVARNAGAVDPAAYTRETAERAVAAGADLRTGTRVDIGDGTVDGEAYDAVVVAAGAHAAALLEAAGLPVPIKAYRVQAFLSAATPLADRVPLLYDATGGYYLRPRDGRLFVGDGTLPEERDPDDWDRAADGWFREDCADYLETAVGEAVPEDRAWAGLCTATPDGDPLVGERAPGVYVAAGFQGHGFMRAPAVGDRLAEDVLGGEGIDAFDPARFDGDEAFEIVEGIILEE